jgi:RNA polymerase sigma-70 factor (sigma-E family)
VDDDDLARFQEFVASSRGSLLLSARRLVSDHALAEDLVQTALERTFASWDRLRATEAAAAYCRRTMLTTCITWSRRRWSDELPTGEVPDRPGDDQAWRVDDAVVLGAALSKLSQRSRLVVLLRYVEDLPEAQVADLLGCSVPSVRSAATRGLAKLRADAGLTA